MRSMRIATHPFDVRRGRVDENLAAARTGVERAAEAGAELVLLPELWPTSFCVATEDPERWARETDEALAEMTALAAELDVVVCGSAFAFEPGEAAPRNRLHVLQGGRDRLAYDKVHLFAPTAETVGFTAGDRPPATVDVDGVRLSGVVCYDLRFGPLLQVPFDDGAEVLLCPAQWPVPRETHWKSLALGRAVEGQCFVVACNRTGTDVVGRRRLELDFPGLSFVADPHGRVLGEHRGDGGPCVVDCDPEVARRLRRRVPVLEARRPEAYSRPPRGDRG